MLPWDCRATTIKARTSRKIPPAAADATTMPALLAPPPEGALGEGTFVGTGEGRGVGAVDGLSVGRAVGCDVGAELGKAVGRGVGAELGRTVGTEVGV